jgi:dTDP-4-dehydrorhamnose 3,5-epimerase/CDP-3, 6-dideoxy-D-glycero-D-glycero-4-hexulose-5-epimerase
MIIESTIFDDVYVVSNKKFVDKRGVFVKTFHKDAFKESGLSTDFAESFYSISSKNVLRGMHFQSPPYDHNKFVYVTSGEVLDVVVDIRKESKTYGKYFSIILSDSNNNSLYIGKGFAHGYLTKSKSATMIYMTSSVHNASLDTGIKWDSFGFNWGIGEPIVSDRDNNLKDLSQF